MDGIAMRRIRLLLSAASVSAMAACLAIVLVAMTPSGEWISIEEIEAPSLSSDGSGTVLRYSAEATSNMPYDLDDLEGEIYLTDPVRGSRALICEVGGLSIPAHGSTVLEIESEISAVTAVLIVRDLAMRDGAPLHFDLVLSCTYMLGMADFRITAGIDVPVTAPGEKLSYGIVEDTEDSFAVAVEGLAGWLMPDDGSLLIADGKHEVRTMWRVRDGVLAIALCAEDLDGTLDAISRSDSPVIVDDAGCVHPIEGDGIRTLIDALDLLGRKA